MWCEDERHVGWGRIDRWALLGRCYAGQSGRSYCTQRRLTSTCGRGCLFCGPLTPTSPGSPARPPAGRRVSCSTEIKPTTWDEELEPFQRDWHEEEVGARRRRFRGTDGVAAESQRKSGFGRDVSIPCSGFTSYQMMLNSRRTCWSPLGAKRLKFHAHFHHSGNTVPVKSLESPHDCWQFSYWKH